MSLINYHKIILFVKINSTSINIKNVFVEFEKYGYSLNIDISNNVTVSMITGFLERKKKRIFFFQMQNIENIYFNV